MDKKKILLIDDDEDFAFTMKARLEEGGDYQVITESKPANAVSDAEKYVPALILLDVIMPGKDGIAVLEELKRDRKTMAIPVIMLSGADDGKLKIESAKRYCESYILKTEDIATLKKKIASILNFYADAANGETEVEQRKEKTPRQSAAKILVIGGEAAAEGYQETFLRSLGYDVSMCERPREALALFSKEKPQIVILDLVASDMSGIGILESIKEMKTDSKIIITTNIHDSGVIKAAVDLGADDVLIKPLSLDQISVTITKHLRRMNK